VVHRSPELWRRGDDPRPSGRVQPDAPSTKYRALFALALASFGIGTTEFVIMGLLPDVAHDLAVTIPQAGLLVTAYALGVAFGAPILAIATARLDRRRALLLLIGIFILGNCLCAIAPSYALLMGARIVTAFSHGAFFGLGAVVAANVVTPGKRAQAIALMFTGLTLANVLGVPFGTALGQAAGWRATFWAVVGIGIVAALALYAWLPRGIKSSGAGLMQEARTLGRTQVLLAMLISVLASASLFSVFTYITPILENVTRESPHQVTWVLLLFGVGLTFGNILGGRLGDWRLLPSVIAIFILLVVVLGVLTITSPMPWLAGTTIFVWGVLAFALVSPLQMRVVNEAEGAPNLASTLNQGAFNIGNAAGAFAGELALTDGVSYASIPWLGVGFAALGLAFSLLSHLLDRRAPRTGHDEPSISAEPDAIPASSGAR
jgi:DHA1 family inner membrane transport protein